MLTPSVLHLEFYRSQYMQTAFSNLLIPSKQIEKFFDNDYVKLVISV